VRGAAVWALSRLLSRERLESLSQRTHDPDPDVREEWDAALA